MLTVGSLFSGIGGFDLGLERAGMRIAWHCEAEPYARRVLAKHWPDIPCYPDIRELRGADVEPVDLLVGGFPCQDISSAGAKLGIAGARSGLWSEYARLIGELRPRYVVVENVAALLARGLGTVLGDLAALGYDAEWDCIPASAVGAPHRRDRVWLVGYPNSQSEPIVSVDGQAPWLPTVGYSPCITRDAAPTEEPAEHQEWRCAEPAGGSGGSIARSPGWEVEPSVDRVVDGVPAGMDRLRALGNALVPQIAEWIGRRILAYEEGCVTA